MSRRSFLADWREAVLDSTLDSKAKLVGLTLSTYMNRDGLAYPAKATLARRTALGVRTVDRAIIRLVSFGLLLVSVSSGRTSNRYRAVLPTPSEGRGSGETTPSQRTANPVRDDTQPRHSDGRKQLKAERKPRGTNAISEERTCFICGNAYKAVDSSNGNRPHLVGHAGQWWCNEHYAEETGIDVDVAF